MHLQICSRFYKDDKKRIKGCVNFKSNVPLNKFFFNYFLDVATMIRLSNDGMKCGLFNFLLRRESYNKGNTPDLSRLV